MYVPSDGGSSIVSVKVADTPLAVHMYTPLSPSSAATISKTPVERREGGKEGRRGRERDQRGTRSERRRKLQCSYNIDTLTHHC